MSKNVKTEFSVDNMINDLVTKANKAKDEMLKLDQEAVDKIVAAMAKAGLEKHIELAKMAVEETNRGVFEDKVTKVQNFPSAPEVFGQVYLLRDG